MLSSNAPTVVNHRVPQGDLDGEAVEQGGQADGEAVRVDAAELAGLLAGQHQLG